MVRRAAVAALSSRGPCHRETSVGHRSWWGRWWSSSRAWVVTRKRRTACATRSSAIARRPVGAEDEAPPAPPAPTRQCGDAAARGYASAGSAPPPPAARELTVESSAPVPMPPRAHVPPCRGCRTRSHAPARTRAAERQSAPGSRCEGGTAKGEQLTRARRCGRRRAQRARGARQSRRGAGSSAARRHRRARHPESPARRPVDVARGGVWQPARLGERAVPPRENGSQ